MVTLPLAVIGLLMTVQFAGFKFSSVAPLLSVVLRKSYGLGALAMIGGSYHASLFTVAWPTAEFGAMGLEGSVKLGFRNELAAIADPEERKGKYQELVASAYEAGKALSRATTFNMSSSKPRLRGHCNDTGHCCSRARSQWRFQS